LATLLGFVFLNPKPVLRRGGGLCPVFLRHGNDHYWQRAAILYLLRARAIL
jgi:hypothetical protein